MFSRALPRCASRQSSLPLLTVRNLFLLLSSLPLAASCRCHHSGWWRMSSSPLSCGSRLRSTPRARLRSTQTLRMSCLGPRQRRRKMLLALCTRPLAKALPSRAACPMAACPRWLLARAARPLAAKQLRLPRLAAGWAWQPLLALRARLPSRAHRTTAGQPLAARQLRRVRMVMAALQAQVPLGRGDHLAVV